MRAKAIFDFLLGLQEQVQASVREVEQILRSELDLQVKGPRNWQSVELYILTVLYNRDSLILLLIVLVLDHEV